MRRTRQIIIIIIIIIIARPTRKNSVQARSQSPLAPEDALKRTYQSVLILKDAMLTYPGCVNFKDEDRTGFSALDYAIDIGAASEEIMLLQSLIRRKEPRVGRPSPAVAVATSSAGAVASAVASAARGSVAQRPIKIWM